MRHLYPLLAYSLIACAGQAPKGATPDDPDAAVDAPPPLVGQHVSGKAIDYFGKVPMTDSTIATDGIDPPMTATSIADGSWSLDNVPTGSKVFLSVSHTNYHPTRNVATTVGEAAVIQDVYLLSIADVNRQYTSVGQLPGVGSGKAFLAAEMQMQNGLPVVGIPLTSVVLLDAANAPVPGVIGPFFFGTVGDIDPAVTTATVFGGTSRVAFLAVPPGSYTLKVTYTDAGADVITTAPVTSVADGAVLALTGGLGSGPPGSAITDPHFETDIYPRLQKAALGGLGCANCHTALGPAALLQYDLPAAQVLASMLPAAPGGRIDTTTPANSLLLTKPLYEPPPALQNHPNATFLDINDPNYKLFLLWITNGLKP